MKARSSLSIKFTTTCERETMRYGRIIGSFLKSGVVVALYGDLGAGKTTFTKGLVAGVQGSAKGVKSPSFALINEYRGTLPVYHIDCYRLDERSDFIDAGIEECMFQDGISIVEWAERIRAYLPESCVKVRIKHIDEKKRQFVIMSTDKNIFKQIRKCVHNA